MTKFSFIQKKKIAKLPKNSGVYCFKNEKEILYIGKAANIQERVKNHFSQPTYRDNLFINQVKRIGYIKTGSEIAALILEARLIKKYQPKYNVLWRDDKNFFYVGITKELLPLVFITHQPVQKLKAKSYKLKANYIGPFVEGASLKKTLTYLRKIFPYYTIKKHPKIPCPWCHLNLCPGPAPNQKEYQKNIKNLIKVLQGEKKSVSRSLKKDMVIASQKQEFEKAAKIREQITSLEKVMSQAKILPAAEVKPLQRKKWETVQKILQKTLKIKRKISRIEAYDVSNIQGNLATGSLVTFIKGRPAKTFYRKFKIKIAGKPNDIAMLREVLTRRFRHLEWGLSDLILIDGGRAQLNVAVNSKFQSRAEQQRGTAGDECEAFSDLPNSKQIKVVAIAKKKNELFIENRKKPILLKKLPREVFNLILQLRDEAHRFARKYHHKLRELDLFPKL